MINPATGELMTEFGPLASAEVILLDEINRIPLKSQSAFLEGAAGPHHHRRQDHLRAAGVQLRHRDDEPGGARPGHVSAVGSRDRSLRDHGQHRLPAAGGRGQAGQLRLQARAPERADVEGAHHRAAGRDHRAGVPARAARRRTSSGWSPPRGPTTPTPTGTSTRRPSWSSTASTSAPRRARSSAGAAWPRSGRCSSASGPRSIPEDIQDLAPYVLGHRIWLGPHAASHGLTTESGHQGRHRAGRRSHEDAATEQERDRVAARQPVGDHRNRARHPAADARVHDRRAPQPVPRHRASTSSACATGSRATGRRPSTGRSRRSPTSAR